MGGRITGLRPFIPTGGVIAIAALLAGCMPPAEPTQPSSPAPEANTSGVVRLEYSTVKFCDQGRAIYVHKLGYSGGIAIVENAPECALPAASTPANAAPGGDEAEGVVNP